MFKRIILMLFILFSINIFAASPAAPILPSDNIQDPGSATTPWGGCGPSDINCYIYITATSSVIVQGGNSFGSTIVIGANDNNALILRTNNQTSAYISSNAKAIWFGQGAGINSSSQVNTFFVGYNSGVAATGASNSNFLGEAAGNAATNASNSNFFGWNSGSGATGASYSNFFGREAGEGSEQASYSNFLGFQSGYTATAAHDSNFFGRKAGLGALNASYSNFIGYQAGHLAEEANNSNFVGYNAGTGATNASYSNFLGYNTGSNATDIYNSNFIGKEAGYSASSAYESMFLGTSAGHSAYNAANSIFIGNNSGYTDEVDNAGGDKYSILIGNYTNTGGFSNSIAIGQGVQNSASDQLNLARIIYATSIGSSTSPTATPEVNAKVGIGTETPLDTLQVFGDIRVGNSGSNGCIKNFAGTGLTGICSSDERLKTDITEIATGTLDKILTLNTVSYRWNDLAKGLNNVNTEVLNYGLIAQNVETVFPEMVSVDDKGYRQIDYSRLPLYILKSLQELSKKVLSLFDGSGDINANKVRGKELCVDDICITRDQFKNMIQSSGTGYTQQNIITTYVTDTASTVIEDNATTTEISATETILTEEIQSGTETEVSVPAESATASAE